MGSAGKGFVADRSSLTAFLEVEREEGGRRVGRAGLWLKSYRSTKERAGGDLRRGNAGGCKKNIGRKMSGGF